MAVVKSLAFKLVVYVKADSPEGHLVSRLCVGSIVWYQFGLEVDRAAGGVHADEVFEKLHDSSSKFVEITK